MGRPSTMIRLLTVTTAMAVVLTGASDATAAVAHPTPQAPTSTSTVAKLTKLAGFATVDANQLVASNPVEALPLSPGLIVDLAPSKGTAHTNGKVTISAPASNGDITVTKVDKSGIGFGVVTKTHGLVEYRYKTVAAPGTTVVPQLDGSLNQVETATGTIVGRIDPARAVDVTGKDLPATYSYDNVSHELIVKADTRNATGSVFIDPSWACYAKLSAYGALFLLGAVGFVFSWSTPAVIWALTTWMRIAPSVATSIAMSCHG